MARALFEEGVVLADQANWLEAVDRFRRAQALKPSPAITFNLASALAETGKIIESSELLQSLARDPAASPELQRACQDKLAEISARRAFLTLQVEHAPADAAIEVDGHDWPQAAWGVASPVDPGAHLVIGRSGTREALRATVELTEGERRELPLAWPLEQAAGPADAPVREAPVAPTEESRRPLYKNWMLWAGVGAVVAGGVLASVLLASKDETTTEAPIAGNAGVIRW